MGKPTKLKSPPPPHRVFISSHGGDLLLRGGFVHEIAKALRSIKVNAYADEPTGEEVVWTRIEKSRIAIVVFSSRYTESRWCFEELVKIKEGMELGELEVIPIFYKLDTSAELEGGSGLNPTMRDFDPQKVKIWNEALDSVSCMMGYHLYKNSVESKFISRIVKDVKRILIQLPKEEQDDESHDSLDDSSKSETLNGGSVLGEAESVEDDIFPNEKVDSVNDQEVSTSSAIVTSNKPPLEHQVFINFQGNDLRYGFVGHIAEALERVGFEVRIDEDELQPGDLTELLFKQIEESRIAIVIFSSRYTESTWCLDKLVKIKERMDEGKLEVVPIFYKVKQLQVTQLEGSFGIRIWNFWRRSREYRVIKWKEALECVGGLKGLVFEEDR
ncbi:unnamed protein product [Brassica oleracea]|nr:unnamed protein product [Brassica napus]